MGSEQEIAGLAAGWLKVSNRVSICSTQGWLVVEAKPSPRKTFVLRAHCVRPQAPADFGKPSEVGCHALVAKQRGHVESRAAGPLSAALREGMAHKGITTIPNHRLEQSKKTTPVERWGRTCRNAIRSRQTAQTCRSNTHGERPTPASRPRKPGS